MTMALFYSSRYGSGTTTAATAYAVTAKRDRPVLYIETGQFPDAGMAIGGGEEAVEGIPTQLTAGLYYIHAPQATKDQVDELVQRFEFVQQFVGSRAMTVVDTHHLSERDLKPDLAWGVVMAKFQDLRTAKRDPNLPRSLIITTAPGWTHSANDVGWDLNRTIAAAVAFDPAVQRSQDAGIIHSRLPRALSDMVAGLELPPPTRDHPSPRTLPTPVLHLDSHIPPQPDPQGPAIA